MDAIKTHSGTSAPTVHVLCIYRAGCRRLTASFSVGGGRAPGGQGRVGEHLVSLQPVGYLPSGDGVLKVLPPGQRGAQQTQRLPRTCRTFQDAVLLLNKANIYIYINKII